MGMGQSMMPGMVMPRGGPRPNMSRMIQQQGVGMGQHQGLDRQAMSMMGRQGMQGLSMANQGMVGRPQQYKYTQVCTDAESDASSPLAIRQTT